MLASVLPAPLSPETTTLALQRIGLGLGLGLALGARVGARVRARVRARAGAGARVRARVRADLQRCCCTLRWASSAMA